MKTTFKMLASVLLLALTVSVSSPTLADDGQSQKKVFAAAVFPAADMTKMWFYLEKYKSENKVSLELIGQRGEVLYQETVLGKNSKRNTCRQQFDMSQLTDGNYTFRITAGTQVEEYTFKLSTPQEVKPAPSRHIAIK
ncbi:hypothetical protein IC229_07985 [Spirosoma sp. BT702]|uniref:T9SS type A sorting domain-containing protein n=1 Tax=Spirosoma profusum TaxID=2771354 RepID=A0A926XVD7_9BACT|nr:hypothetical protein [Spirosoma profusum]MBD2700570.1 hypothetical protein [Spirosoma profusum]